MNKEKSATIKSMRLSDDVISYINEIRKDENRSFSNMVEHILKNNMKQLNLK